MNSKSRSLLENFSIFGILNETFRDLFNSRNRFQNFRACEISNMDLKIKFDFYLSRWLVWSVFWLQELMTIILKLFSTDLTGKLIISEHAMNQPFFGQILTFFSHFGAILEPQMDIFGWNHDETGNIISKCYKNIFCCSQLSRHRWLLFRHNQRDFKLTTRR